jgi:hypothetical protein
LKEEGLTVALGHAVSVFAREQIPKARFLLRLAVVRRLVRSVRAVVVAGTIFQLLIGIIFQLLIGGIQQNEIKPVPIAVPAGGDAPMIGAPERVGGALTLRAVQRVLVRSVTTVVVPASRHIKHVLASL